MVLNAHAPKQNKGTVSKMPNKPLTPSEITQKIELKGSTMLGALPAAMVSCGTIEHPNIITVAWTGIVNSQPPVTYVSVRPERYSHGLIMQNKEFVINLTTKDMAYACDFCGIYTGAKVDKFVALGLTPTPSEKVSAPMILECPISLSCRVREVVHLGSHDMFLADIMGVSVSPALLDKTGKIHLDKANLMLSMHGAYYEVGAFLGKLGFSTHQKPTQPTKAQSPIAPRNQTPPPPAKAYTTFTGKRKPTKHKP